MIHVVVFCPRGCNSYRKAIMRWSTLERLVNHRCTCGLWFDAYEPYDRQYSTATVA